MTPPSYRILPECVLRQLGESRLLMVYPQDDVPHCLQVNESFFELFRHAQGLPAITAADLAAYLSEHFALDGETAAQEADRTIALWLELKLIG